MHGIHPLWFRIYRTGGSVDHGEFGIGDLVQCPGDGWSIGIGVPGLGGGALVQVGGCVEGWVELAECA